jgi:predicted dinucleotide-binding enzyme
VIALAKEIGFEGVDAGHLDASRNVENLGLSWDSLPTDEASETALCCVPMWRRERFGDDLSM